MNENKPKNALTLEEKIQKEKSINLMWRAMARGFSETDPTLARKWGAKQPAGGISSKTGNPLLVMHCQEKHVSIIVEYSEDTGLYLLSTCKEGSKDIQPLTTVLAPEAIAPSIIEYMAK